VNFRLLTISLPHNLPTTGENSGKTTSWSSLRVPFVTTTTSTPAACRARRRLQGTERVAPAVVRKHDKLPLPAAMWGPREGTYRVAVQPCPLAGWTTHNRKVGRARRERTPPDEMNNKINFATRRSIFFHVHSTSSVPGHAPPLHSFVLSAVLSCGTQVYFSYRHGLKTCN